MIKKITFSIILLFAVLSFAFAVGFSSGIMDFGGIKPDANKKIAEDNGQAVIKENESPAENKEDREEKVDLLEGTTYVNAEGLTMIKNPDDILVLVNKKRNLPSDWEPKDLVVPDVKFAFEGDAPRKYMRQEAAEALEELFEKAEKDGIDILATSGYRSYDTQKRIFNNNAKIKGEKEANRTSAKPGQSEHQTGLAMDLTSKEVGYNLVESFGDTKEGKWLVENAADFGFIIRYPKDTEDITGYSYEPWHIRYVGKEVAKEVMSKGITLEEYFGQA